MADVARAQQPCGGVIGQPGELGRIPVDRADGGGAVGITQHGDRLAQNADHLACVLAAQTRRQRRRPHGHAGVVDAAESGDQGRGLLGADLDHVAGHRAGNIVGDGRRGIERRIGNDRGRLTRSANSIRSISGIRGGHGDHTTRSLEDVVDHGVARAAAVVGPTDRIPAVRGIIRDAW